MKRNERPDMTETPENRDPTQTAYPRRPFPLRLIFWILLLWIVLGWLRFGQALQNRALILAYTSPGIFVYLVGMGLIWGLAGLPALWGLNFRNGWARWVIGLDGLLYPVLYWVERLLLWQDESARVNWPFMLALTFIWLGVVLWGLFGKAGRTYFSEKKA